MGKYMNKSKISADVAVMELSHSQSTTLGVRTRAKTLALQRLHSSIPNPDSSSFSYLQLRSRRLEKPPPPPPTTTTATATTTLFNDTKKQIEENPKIERSSAKKLNSKGSSRLSKSLVKVCPGDCEKVEEEDGCFGIEAEDLRVEASFGENCLEFEPREERGTRESTPCSFIRDSDTIGTPGSTSRKTSSSVTNRRVRNDIQRNIPTTHEMEEFFACAEQRQQRLFIEKYNFDVVNDLPLHGHYEWVQVIP